MSNEQDFIMGEVGTYEDLTIFHPALNQIRHYWQVYVDNCEVILRMMHEPTVAVVVEDAIRTNLEARNFSCSQSILLPSLVYQPRDAKRNLETNRRFCLPGISWRSSMASIDPDSCILKT
jgi:hypothetical protein